MEDGRWKGEGKEEHTRVEPLFVPSYLAPTPLPFKYLAQSVIAGVHSPTTTQFTHPFNVPLCPQAALICPSSLNPICPSLNI